MAFILHSWRPLLYLAVLASYLCWSLTGSFLVQVSFAVLLILLIIQAIPGSSGRNRNVSLGLFGLGCACLILSGVSWQAWLSSITSNGGLVVLFISLPLLSFLLGYEDYQSALDLFFKSHIRSASKFNILVSWLIFFLAAIINLAGVQLIYDLMNKNAEQYSTKEDFYRALVRGNSGPVFWAPNYMCVATVLTYTNLSWLAIAPLGFVISCALMLIITLFFCLPFQGKEKAKMQKLSEQAKQVEPASHDTAAMEEVIKKGSDPKRASLLQLFVIYLGLIIAIAALSYRTKLSILAIVPIIGLTYPLLVAVFMRKLPTYRKQFNHYFHNRLPKIKNEIILFAAVGFFGKTLVITGIGNWLANVLHFKDIPYPSLAILAIIGFVSLLAIMGIHPIVTIAALASAMTASDLGLSSLGYAYTLLFSDAIGGFVSPFSGISLMMSGITGENPWYVVPRLNFAFAVFIAFVFAIPLSLI